MYRRRTPWGAVPGARRQFIYRPKGCARRRLSAAELFPPAPPRQTWPGRSNRGRPPKSFAAAALILKPRWELVGLGPHRLWAAFRGASKASKGGPAVVGKGRGQKGQSAVACGLPTALLSPIALPISRPKLPTAGVLHSPAISAPICLLWPQKPCSSRGPSPMVGEPRPPACFGPLKMCRVQGRPEGHHSPLPRPPMVPTQRPTTASTTSINKKLFKHTRFLVEGQAVSKALGGQNSSSSKLVG